jgi:hypothetical protein
MLVVLPLVLGGCLGRDASEPDANAFPTAYKTMIVDLLQRQLDDPTNIRDAAISAPEMRPVMQSTQRYVSCLRYNPRNARLEYSGLVYRMVYYYVGQVNQIVPATAEQCGWANLQPFPELEKICMSTRCS